MDDDDDDDGEGGGLRQEPRGLAGNERSGGKAGVRETTKSKAVYTAKPVLRRERGKSRPVQGDRGMQSEERQEKNSEASTCLPRGSLHSSHALP